MKKKKSLFAIILIFCMVFATVPLFTTAKPQQTVIKIGTLVPDKITPGIDANYGAELAVEEINTAGGITIGSTTYTFALVKETTSGDLGFPDATTAAMGWTKLAVQHDVLAAIGGFRTEVMQSLQLGGHLDRPFLGVGATVPLISPYFWRVMPGNGTGLALATVALYAYELIPVSGVRNITIFREDDMWALKMSTAFKENIPNLAYAAGAVASPADISFGDDIVVSTQATLDAVTTALGAGVDDDCNALATIFSGPVGKYATQAWAALELPQILAGTNVESQASTFWDATEGGCYGEILMQPAAPGLESTPTTQAFTDAYIAKAGKTPTYCAYGAYESVYIIKEALERMSAYNAATASADLQAELLNTDYYGPRSRIRFTSEPLQQGVNVTGGSVDIPGADVINGGADVHDTWTSNGIFAPGSLSVTPLNLSEPHIIFTQWQEGGAHVAVAGHACLPASIVDGSLFSSGIPLFNSSEAYYNWTKTGSAAYIDPTALALVPYVPLFIGNYSGYENPHYPGNLSAMLYEGNWTLFDHADHGWTPEPEPTTEPPSTTAPTSTTEPETREVTGFTLPLVFFVVISIALIVRRLERKKR